MKEIISMGDVEWFMAYYRFLVCKKPWAITGIATRLIGNDKIEVWDLGLPLGWKEVDKHIALVGVDA